MSVVMRDVNAPRTWKCRMYITLSPTNVARVCAGSRVMRRTSDIRNQKYFCRRHWIMFLHQRRFIFWLGHFSESDVFFNFDTILQIFNAFLGCLGHLQMKRELFSVEIKLKTDLHTWAGNRTRAFRMKHLHHTIVLRPTQNPSGLQFITCQTVSELDYSDSDSNFRMSDSECLNQFLEDS
jgi:hypothetical protein